MLIQILPFSDIRHRALLYDTNARKVYNRATGEFLPQREADSLLAKVDFSRVDTIAINQVPTIKGGGACDFPYR